MELTLNLEYSKLLPKHSKEDFDNLRESIREHGVWTEIVINLQNEILDGHNRYLICKQLGIEDYPISVKEFDSKLEEKKFVIECNLNRRHLNDFQKAELGIPLLEIEKELAKERQGERTDLTSSSNEDNVRTNTVVSKKIGVSKSTFERAKKIIENAPEELKDRLREGKTSISKEYTKLVNEEKKSAKKAEISKNQVNLPDTIQLHNNYFQKLIIPAKSIGLIITDPPYDYASMHLYGDVANQANVVLRDGGSLFCYCNNHLIPKIIADMESHGLTYQWTMTILHSGPHATNHSPPVLVGNKPMLWFTKGKYTGDYLRDTIQSKYQGQDLHEWQQSTVEAEYFIEHTSQENEIVYDPMMGAGTFGIAALKLKRQFIGCEVNQEHYQNARSNIAINQ